MTSTPSRHRLAEVDADLLERLPEAHDLLMTRGVPAEVRLPGWVGPSLFTPALGAGRIDRLDGRFVLGHVREVDDPGEPHATFVLDAETGEVQLIDAEAERFVNGSLGQFLDSIDAFVAAWPNADAVQLQAALAEIDGQACRDGSTYWSCWVAELVGVD